MAKKLSKRVAANRAKVELGKLYDVKEAIDLVKGCASAKFDESFDVAVQLGIDPKKSDQTVRGACVLPEGTVVGEDREADARRFRVTPKGITLVTPEMLGQTAPASVS